MTLRARAARFRAARFRAARFRAARAGVAHPRPGGRSRRAAAALLAVVAVAATAACDGVDATAAPDRPKLGGTLRVVLGAMPTHLDPQKLNVTTDANISRIVSRTLTTFRAEPGQAASGLVGDLATDVGRPSEDNTVWEFTLKPGIKWEDGSPVTCGHVKYGVERSFAPEFATGASYARSYLLDNPTPYKGPFVDGNNSGRGLESITCVDDSTIRFRLRRPVGDFGYTVALSVFAPVQPGRDKDLAAYDKRPLATGPYRITEATASRIVLVRNPHWDRRTDLVRPAYADQIVITTNPNTAVVTNDLILDQGDAASTILLDADVASNFVQQVINDAELSRRAVVGPSGIVRFFSVNYKLLPDLECRHALAYGFNKRKFRAAMGGSMFGDLATSVIPPSQRSFKEFDHFGTKTNQDGQPDRARQVLADAAKAGKRCPTRLKLAYPDRSTVKRFMTTVVESYTRIGVQVELVPLPAESYYDRISDSGGPYHLRYAGWVADWANGSAVIPPLYDGRTVLPPGKPGTTNWSFLTDPEVDRLIDQALAEADLERQYVMWGELDSRIQQLAVTIPVIHQNALRLAGSNVRGGFIHPQYGQPDLAALGLADPARSTGS